MHLCGDTWVLLAANSFPTQLKTRSQCSASVTHMPPVAPAVFSRGDVCRLKDIFISKNCVPLLVLTYSNVASGYISLS